MYTRAARNNAKYVSEALIYLRFHKSKKKSVGTKRRKKRVLYIHGVIKTNISDTAEECTCTIKKESV